MRIELNVATELQMAVAKELYASHLYKHIANKLQFMSLCGGQEFYLHEAKEELEHYQKIVDYLNEVGVSVSVPAVPAMDGILIDGYYAALSVSLQAETELLDFYVSLYEKADPVTEQFLAKFLKIQRKAVAKYDSLMKYFSLLESNKQTNFDNYIKGQIEKDC